ncbi:MAG: hypothetical protein ACK4FJ_01265 [Ferrovibrio sp.]|uniref:hypothetical protein n=1 Tax=Ferrovibrio sp. TaxID=1917215 RepID=UPI00391CEE59
MLRLSHSVAAEALRFAAAPTFAVMALLTGLLPDPLCLTAPESLPLNGMALMYALMSVFHAGPWLKLMTGETS